MQLKLKVFQSADGQGVLSLADRSANRKRDRSLDNEKGGGGRKRARVLNQFRHIN